MTEEDKGYRGHIGALQFAYDPGRDVLIIEGIRYHGDFFRGLSFQLAVNTPFQIVERKDGVLSVQRLSPQGNGGDEPRQL